MAKITRRKWLVAAGTTTAAVGVATLAGKTRVKAQEATPASKHNYNYKNVSPRELIQRRHLPNVELITQNNEKSLCRIIREELKHEKEYRNRKLYLDVV